MVAEHYSVAGESGAQADLHAIRAAYDDAPYESYAHPVSAPGHVAATAWLFGLDPPEVVSARVLEIGCAAAGNLIPFAAAHPTAHTVGIDLSPTHIELGRERVRALGLGNVRLVEGDIARVDLKRLGQFDFVICHGVYSWVPADLQTAILNACRESLAPNGIAYISYNVYPGWKAKEIVRDAMLLSVGDAVDPEQKVQRARSAVEFLRTTANPDSVLGHALADYAAMASETGDYYLLHEELEAFNAPCYFREFMQRARGHGLEYLADAQLEYMFPANYGQATVEHLAAAGIGDQVSLEQHLDFVVNRSHRQTLLVHRGRAPHVSHTLDRTRIRGLHIASAATAVDPDPVVGAALEVLNARWPWTTSRQELLAAARTRLADAGIAEPSGFEAQIDALVEVLLVQGRTRFRLDPVRGPEASSRPSLPDPVRRMAELTRDDAEAFTFSPWHESVPLGPLERHLLPLLDGTTDRDGLLAAALDLFRQNVFAVDRDGEALSDPSEIEQALADEVDAMPQRLVELKLLSNRDD
ncbi:MAG: hypothetical protein JWR11_3186 [Mycobacterium sp.]|nr:hypothetical protein [Mycobacterium sp.]